MPAARRAEAAACDVPRDRRGPAASARANDARGREGGRSAREGGLRRRGTPGRVAALPFRHAGRHGVESRPRTFRSWSAYSAWHTRGGVALCGRHKLPPQP
eukprot:scaffold624_cov402-Prasinococcus_capsulatus_cf.AAC.20